MTLRNTTSPPPPGVFERLMMMLCPSPDRRWLQAMFAEAASMAAEERMRWLLGAVSIIGFVIRSRAAATVPTIVWWGIVVTAHALVIFAFGSRSDVETLWMDDDVFLRYAWVTGVLLLGLCVLAINRTFNHESRGGRL